MLTRRGFGGCALCASLATVAAGGAAAQAPGFTRTVVRQEEMAGGTLVALQVMVEVAPGGAIERHTHPGIESGIMLEGEVELAMEGRPVMRMKAGDSYLVPTGVPHSARGGARPSKVLATFVVEKGKPLASLAPA